MKRKRIVIVRIAILLLIIVAALSIFYFIREALQTKEFLASPIAKESIRYLEEHQISPIEYTINKFTDHDVVFLGEYHRIKSQVEFIAEIIPELQSNGIYILVTEFARHVDQPLIDELITKKEWDEKLARQITFNFDVFWGQEEYIEIYKAAWKVNQNLEENDREFRILGMNVITDWSYLQKPEDENNPVLRSKVWGDVQDFEALWAEVIIDEVINKDEKALVYCGIHHAFTAYRQPVYDFEKNQLMRLVDQRVGNHVYSAIGNRCMTIAFHNPWVSSKNYDKRVLPVDGSIDRIMKKMNKKVKAIGFDTTETPLGELTSTTSLYQYGYDNFTLKDFCDGYLYLEPFSKLEAVTPINNFINEENLIIAQQQCPDTDYRNATVKRFNKTIRNDANFMLLLRFLH